MLLGNLSSFHLNGHWNENATFALLDIKHARISDKEFEFEVKLYGKYPRETFFQLQPAKYFIVAEIDISSLKTALQVMKKSTWWNAYGFFMIQKIYLNSCIEAYDYLKIVWSFNILSVIFICMDLESKIRIHTFNPYSDFASAGWAKYKSVRQTNGHPLVLFKYHLEFYGKSFEYSKILQCNTHIGLSKIN